MAALVLTQPLGRLEVVREALQARGHGTFALPFTQLSVCTVALAELARARFEDYERIVFVSRAAVGFGAAALSLSLLDHPGVAAIGSGTAEALKRHGVLREGCSPIMPHAAPFDADALLPLLRQPEVNSLAIIKGRGGREDWLTCLRSDGRRVAVFEVYDSRPCTPDLDEVSALARYIAGGARPITLLSSRQAIQALVSWRPAAALLPQLLTCPTLAVHPAVASVAQAAGFIRVCLPEQGDSLLQAALSLADGASDGPERL